MPPQGCVTVHTQSKVPFAASVQDDPRQPELPQLQHPAHGEPTVKSAQVPSLADVVPGHVSAPQLHSGSQVPFPHTPFARSWQVPGGFALAGQIDPPQLHMITVVLHEPVPLQVQPEPGQSVVLLHEQVATEPHVQPDPAVEQMPPDDLAGQLR